MAPSAGNNAGLSDHTVVFIDTNLDTHLAINISDSDTVSDFKGKVMLEHRRLFPVIGDIRVECLKVKQRGNFYHLSDSVLVKNAFDSTKRNWFVSVDVSRFEQNVCIRHLGKHKDGDHLALPWVAHSHSIERQDNRGSPSVRSKIVPFVNQKVFSLDQLTSAGSCKDAVKNVEEDRSCDDTPGPSVKKKRKTESVIKNVQPFEENIALTYVNDKANDGNNRTNIGENCYGLDQVATAGDVEMVVENNIQEETPVGMSQMEEESELVRKPALENEIHSSLTSKDAIKSSSQKDVGSDGKECAGDQIDKYKDDSEISLKQKLELKRPGMKKGTMGSENIGEGKRRKTKKLFKHSDNVVGISSTVPASIIDERKMNEDLEKTLVVSEKDDDVMIVKEVDTSVENLGEKSRKEFTDTNDVVSILMMLRHSISMMNNDAEISTLGQSTSQVNAEGVSNNLEKQNEKVDGTTKKRKKRKTTKSAGRNEDEPKTKYVDGDSFGNVKEGDSSLPDADRKDGDKVEEKDAQISLERLVEKAEKNNKSQDLPSKHQSNEVELESKKSQSVDHHHLPEKTLKKTKDDPRNDQSWKRVSENVNNKGSIDVLKDQNTTNTDNLKTPKNSSKINAQKTTKQQSIPGQANVKFLKKKIANCLQQVKSLLNTPGTIFGDDSFDNASVNLDCSTRTPSEISSPSSSSEERLFSQYSRKSMSHARKGQEDAGKNNENSQSESKRISMTAILRSSSRFKKVKSQVEDTKSQPVEFVTDNQPMRK